MKEKNQSEATQIKRDLGNVKKGTHVGGINPYRLSENGLVFQFGCNACAWRDTPMCPHGITGLKTHNHKICSQRVLYVKGVFDIVKNKPKFMQIEEATRLKLLLDKLTMYYTQEGDLSPELAKLSKNLITHLDKMRRQDEGIKRQIDMDVTVKDFRKVVDEQAKALNGKSILDAEFSEFDKNADKSNNRTG